MKVSLSTSFSPVKAPGTNTHGAPMLAPKGARVILGSDGGELIQTITPAPHMMFGPRGVCLHPDGSLWVSDTGHHRVLGWKTLPTSDDVPADILLGQPEFGREGRNANGKVEANTLNVPTGITAFQDGLAIADPWNHRVLIWKETPKGPDHYADIVLGQPNANSSLANVGLSHARADTMHWPYGISSDGDRLIVCDTGNRRVLIWEDVHSKGQIPDLVLGQKDFTCRDENGGEAVSDFSMRWPHMAISHRGGLAVADAGNNRVMIWETFPTSNGQAPDTMLGQANMTDCDHNMASYYPTSQAMNMPYALVSHGSDLIVADTANSRILGFDDHSMAAHAYRLTAQPDFAAKGDNRWGIAERDTVCWPYGMSSLGNTIAIADSGNNRVLIWDVAD